MHVFEKMSVDGNRLFGSLECLFFQSKHKTTLHLSILGIKFEPSCGHFRQGNVHKWCPILGGEGGSSKMGQNGTRGVGRRAKIGRPIFQEFLLLFLLIYRLFFPCLIYFFFVSVWLHNKYLLKIQVHLIRMLHQKIYHLIVKLYFGQKRDKSGKF